MIGFVGKSERSARWGREFRIAQMAMRHQCVGLTPLPAPADAPMVKKLGYLGINPGKTLISRIAPYKAAGVQRAMGAFVRTKTPCRTKNRQQCSGDRRENISSISAIAVSYADEGAYSNKHRKRIGW